MKRNKITIIIVMFLFLGITIPQLASAVDPLGIGGALADAGMSLMRAIAKLIINMATFIANAAADFFEMMLNEAFKGHQDIAKVGWTVTRDIANMFFIIFMVVIAFGTILRIERYGVKDLLPRIIIVALLINFSMVICYVMIDFSNIVADFFISNSKQAIPGQAIPLTAIFIDGFKLPDLYIPITCEHWLDERDKCYNESMIEKDIQVCVQKAESALNTCYATEANSETVPEDDFWDVIVAALGSGAVLLVAAFIFGAGGFMLAIRIVAIWFLVMIAPLAFICYILPALKKNWESWWSNFTRWCIFAPAYCFFIWLAAKISLEQKLDSIGKLQTSISMRDNQAINTFFSSTGNMLHFIFLGGILIGGLIVANSLGIAGARSAMTLGKKWTGTAKGWVTKNTRKGVEKATQTPRDLLKYGRGAAVKRTGTVLQNIPGFKKWGERMEQRGKIRQELAVEKSPVLQQRQKEAEKMDPLQRINQFMSASTLPTTKKILANLIEKNGDAEKIDDDEKRNTLVRGVANYLQAGGETKKAEEYKKKYSDSTEDRRELHDRLKEMYEKKELTKLLSGKALKDPRVLAELMNISSGNLKLIEEIRNMSKEHENSIKATLNEITDPYNAGNMATLGINPNDNALNMARATQTGETDRLNDFQEGLLGKAGIEGLRRIKTPTLQMLRYLPASQLKRVVDGYENDAAARETISIIKANQTLLADHYRIITSDRYLNSLAPDPAGGPTPPPTPAGGTPPRP